MALAPRPGRYSSWDRRLSGIIGQTATPKSLVPPSASKLWRVRYPASKTWGSPGSTPTRGSQPHRRGRRLRAAPVPRGSRAGGSRRDRVLRRHDDETGRRRSSSVHGLCTVPSRGPTRPPLAARTERQWWAHSRERTSTARPSTTVRGRLRPIPPRAHPSPASVLDRSLGLSSRATRAARLNAMRGHVLAAVETLGTCEHDSPLSPFT